MDKCPRCGGTDFYTFTWVSKEGKSTEPAPVCSTCKYPMRDKRADTPPVRPVGEDDPHRHIVELAVEVSGWSPCQSKRGVVIFDRASGDVVSHGHNYKPRAFACDGSDACKATCRDDAVHAEQQALLSARGAANGADLLHVKAVDGRLVPSGGPSCVQCSKLAVACGIAGVWLFHETGWKRYDIEEFHRLSLVALTLTSQQHAEQLKEAHAAGFTRAKEEAAEENGRLNTLRFQAESREAALRAELEQARRDLEEQNGTTHALNLAAKVRKLHQEIETLTKDRDFHKAQHEKWVYVASRNGVNLADTTDALKEARQEIDTLRAELKTAKEKLDAYSPYSHWRTIAEQREMTLESLRREIEILEQEISDLGDRLNDIDG